MARKYQVRLKTLADVRRFLARVANDLDADVIDATKARTLGYLGATLQAVIRDSSLEERVTNLEKSVSGGK